jgi:hypothetical protein
MRRLNDSENKSNLQKFVETSRKLSAPPPNP